MTLLPIRLSSEAHLAIRGVPHRQILITDGIGSEFGLDNGVTSSIMDCLRSKWEFLAVENQSGIWGTPPPNWLGFEPGYTGGSGRRKLDLIVNDSDMHSFFYDKRMIMEFGDCYRSAKCLDSKPDKRGY
ncbi:hypothetical protein CEXT_522711 [Caerostris extrusa]|uniref:Uncharacterized protein n=1 Tax=Caerostris extrusa TaxID=172846 RepID=A0AAV4WCS8_CAEEX|nr:hypothetical protein CEXT_522711 [Caerostris extrusa]